MRFGKLGLGLLVGLAFVSIGQLSAQVVVEEHWSGYDYPREIPEGIQYHIVMDGDTLWDLAAQYLGDPLLWPQLYQANDYIQDPNLIYPGDPILLNVGVIVTEDSIAQSESDGSDGSGGSGAAEGAPGEEGTFSDEEGITEFVDAEEDGSSADTSEGGSSQDTVGDTDGEYMEFEELSLDSEFVILPAGERSDMECSTYIYHTESSGNLPFDLIIGGSEDKNLNYSEGDVVYLNQGINNGIQAGDVYSVRREVSKVYDPGNARRLIGSAIDQVGKVRIVAVQDVNATAVIIENCRDVSKGDFLVPYEQEPIPLITELPTTDRWGKLNVENFGHIIYSEDRVLNFGKGHLMNVDLGIEENVAPGDLFVIYRPNPNNNEGKNMMLPDIFLGHAVALRTSSKSTVVKVIDSHTNITVGDRVAPISIGSYEE